MEDKEKLLEEEYEIIQEVSYYSDLEDDDNYINLKKETKIYILKSKIKITNFINENTQIEG